MGDTDAQRQNKGNGHGTGGNTAGIKCHAEEIGSGKSCKNKYYAIESDEQPTQLDAGDNAQHAHRKEKADADADRDQQHGIIDVRDCFRQHLQIRFCNGDGKTQHKADNEDQRQIARFGQRCADSVANGGHGGFRAQREKTDPHNDKNRADQKTEQ